MHIRCSSLLSLIGVCLGGCLGSEFGSTLHAQAAFLTTPEAYLGQTPPSYTPKIFAPGLLADDGAEQAMSEENISNTKVTLYKPSSRSERKLV